MLQKANVSLGDIARELGVSVTTVSRVLNARDGDIRISRETQNRVLEAADKLGYHRNELAFAIRSKRTGLIGAINRSVSGSMGSVFAHQLQVQAHENGIEVLCGLMWTDRTGMARQVAALEDQLFDGYVILGEPVNLAETLNRLTQSGKPFVCLGSVQADDIAYVCTDYPKGVEMSLDHLWSKGHRRIGYLGIAGIRAVEDMRQRFAQILTARGGFDPALVFDLGGLAYAPEDMEFMHKLHLETGKVASQILAADEQPTAIVCGADGLAFGLVKALQQAGKKVPEDIAVIGFDDSREAFWCAPELTTVRHPLATIIDTGLKALLAAIESGDQTRVQELVTPEFIVRKSA
jgi:LacI family transcriptional regulator, repressor for deo operon, udp, cdd, tsx, nupC, and nupG